MRVNRERKVRQDTYENRAVSMVAVTMRIHHNPFDFDVQRLPHCHVRKVVVLGAQVHLLAPQRAAK